MVKFLENKITEEELQILNDDDFDTKKLKNELSEKDRKKFTKVYKIFRDMSDNWDWLFLNFLIEISKNEKKYKKFLWEKWFNQETLNSVINSVISNIDKVLNISDRENQINFFYKEKKKYQNRKIKSKTKEWKKWTVNKNKKENIFKIDKVRKLPNNSFIIDLKKEWLKKRIWFLSFKEVEENIYYIDGFSVDDKFKKNWLWEKLMNNFKDFLWQNWMCFLNDHTSNYWITSPYIKYWWNKENFTPELASRKVFYYWNDTKDKKIKLKQAAKKFYNNN